MKHFLLPDLDVSEYNKDLTSFAVNDAEWSFYGKGRFAIYIAFPPRDLVVPLALKFKNPKNLFLKMEMNKVLPMGIVPPHTDHHRYATINIPLKGDFDNSYLDFYKSIKEGVSASPLNNDEETAGKGMFYPEAELDYQVNYNVPVCFDTQEIHGVTNATNSTRYILTMSFREEYTFDKILKMYQENELLV